jgi:hypothetical protein
VLSLRLLLSAAPIVAAASLAACGGGSGTAVDRADYIRANERLFRGVPQYPGTTRMTEESAPYYEEEDGPVAGYGTRFDFRLPAGTAGAAVAGFYAKKLSPAWRLVERLDGPVLNFRRSKAVLSINLESWRGHVLEIYVDHARYG